MSGITITVTTVLSLLGLGIAFYYMRKVTSVPVDMGLDEKDGERLRFIHGAIADGAMAFLKQEYKFLVIFMVVFAAIIAILIDDSHTPGYREGIYTAIAFLFGAAISIASGYIGMMVATQGNARTTVAAKKNISEAFDMAINAGAVMGFALVGLAALGLVIIYVVMSSLLSGLGPENNHILMEVIAGFGLGGSTIALFARVGGGIFTKAADVGADLVGKVEKGIPEDDPRNPAVIADNVGDNVGDVAGMGADLFGSCAESTCAAMVISAVVFAADPNALLYPILITAVGIPVSLVTKLLIGVKSEEDVAPALRKLLIISSILMAIVMFFFTMALVPEFFELNGEQYTNMGVYWCFLSGLIAGLAVGLLTDYYTSDNYKPVQELAGSCETGVATNIIFGLSLGYKSTVYPYLCIAASIFISWGLAGMYGVAIASLGMLGTLVIALMIDAYGPVADNAGGIAEMSEMGEETREITDSLDEVGNTTAAIGKGFAISAAALAALALISAYIEKISGTDSSFVLAINDPLVLAGMFLGGIFPFLVSSMTMTAVGDAAFDMIKEIRRQFKEIPGLLEGKAKPDTAKCVDIATKAALRKMVAPGALAVLAPVVVGTVLGPKALGGMLGGALICCVMMALMMANAGGAWDNAKKYVEKGNLGGKGSEVHKAAVVGDTVGDPLKDTSGPSMNILINVMAIVSLVIAPLLV